MKYPSNTGSQLVNLKHNILPIKNLHPKDSKDSVSG